MKTNKKKSLKDIADELNLSISTVHRALNGYGRINKETKSLILKKAEEFGYEANLAARALASGKKIKLCFIYPDTPFYADIVRGARQAEKELSIYGLTVDYKTTESYSAIQQSEVLNRIIEDMNAEGDTGTKTLYDGIGIPPAHPILLNPLFHRLRKGGTKIVTFDNDAPESKRSYFIGQNSYVAGKTSAQIYASVLPKGSTVALMASFVSALGLRKRTEGFLEEATGLGLNVIGPFEYNDRIEDAYDMSKQVIITNNVDALFTNSMYGSIGCARAIEETGNSGKIFMTGFDLDDEIARQINNGTIYATIHQSPYLQGYYTVKTLYERCSGKGPHATGDKKHDVKYIKSYIILKSNLEEFLKEEYL